MDFQIITLDQCARASGVVVVIDVCRAFTTAAFAFAAGARQILLVSTVEEAVDWKVRLPGSLTLGEVGGLPVEEFDFWNSPAEIRKQDLTGRLLIQRTSSGTQGMILSSQAGERFAGSFVVAGATVNALRQLNPPQVTFVNTGARWNAQAGAYTGGEEDRACAEYMIALLQDQNVSPSGYLGWVKETAGDLSRLDPSLEQRFKADIECCQQVDTFNFGMQASYTALDGETVTVLNPVFAS